MGNKLCKKKSEGDNPKSPTPFDRIINRLHLRPNSWKSDSHLNQKQVNRTKTNDKDKANNQLLSKSSDWTDAALEVPEKDEAIHLRNPKLSLIFDNENSTPTPPPRKHKGIREKIEAVAKNSLQAFQKKPVEEPLCVKKIVKPTCPYDHDCAIHKHEKEEKKEVEEDLKQAKRRKNLSVVSLPNVNELKLSVANFEDDKKSDNGNSLVSLPNDQKKLPTTASTGKLETCMTRCRSFGSLLPQQLLEKLKVRKIPIDVESDDSFGGLEDWDLRIIEHYNPTDTSLPRQTKPIRSKKELLSDVENLIVQEEEPKAPARRSESLLKKINREASESAVERCNERNIRCKSVTPPPTPIRGEEKNVSEESGVEHSSLMKILEEFSIRDKQNSDLQKKIDSVEDFLNNEKLMSNMEMVKT